MMKTSQAGIDLIKKHESLKLHSYLCPAGKWTIGYGSTTKVKEGMTITPEQAEQRLAFDLDGAEAAVNNYVKVPLTQPQFDALVSFVFNVGAGAFQSSTLLAVLNQGDYKGAAAQFKRWEYGGGKVLAGLSKRRKEEAIMFMKPLTKSSTMKVASVTGAVGAVTAVTSTLAIIEPALPVVRAAASIAQDYPLGVLVFGGVLLLAVAGFMVWKRIDDRRKGIK